MSQPIDITKFIRRSNRKTLLKGYFSAMGIVFTTCPKYATAALEGFLLAQTTSDKTIN